MASIASLQKVLKVLYPQTKIPHLSYEKSAFLGRVKKVSDFKGKRLEIANRYAGTGGGSFTFADAQSGISGSKYEAFWLTRAKDYSLLRIDTEAARASESGGALVKGIKAEGDGAFYTIGRSMSRMIWGNGGGARGVIAGGGGTPTLQLANVDDIVGFEVGMWVSVAADDGTGVNAELKNNAQQITAVDRDLGRITAAGNWDAADFANGRWLFRRGDKGGAIAGVQAWLPASHPTSGDDFFGVDRSVDSRLSGVRYTATASDGSVERALVNAAGRAYRESATPDECYVNPMIWAALDNELGAKAKYERLMGQGMDGKEAKFGFDAIMLTSPVGRIKVIADLDCPKNTAFMLDMKTWCFHSLGSAPGFLDDDGKGEWLRVGNADAMEARIGFYGNLSNEAPGQSLRVDLTAVL